MRKQLFISITTVTMVFFLLTACAEESKESVVAATAETEVTDKVTEPLASEASQDDSIMSQPVDFSTPESVETTLQNIREQAGAKAYRQLDGAMKYILYYDLSVKNNKDILYKKLDGKTPEQIIAKGKHGSSHNPVNHGRWAWDKIA